MKRDLVSVLDMEKDFEDFIMDGIELKKRFKRGEMNFSLTGKTLAMIFEKPSTRTRVSFETAMTQLGGHAIYLSPRDMQMGRGETVADTARVLSGMVDGIMYRAFDNKNVNELARHATVSVINGLDDIEHPTQIVADFMTVFEHKGKFKGLKMAYIGDGNNTCNSLMLGAALLGVDFYAATPKGFEPMKDFVRKAREIAKRNGSQVIITNDPKEGAKDADIIYTDVWISMGQEKEGDEKEKKFKAFQINKELVSKAKKNYIFMHCLPAHRGLEVTDEVADSKNSVIFDEAENRLHAEKIILLKTIAGF
ncbi:MAG: ornithine carbamoyltransferase [Candidatus Thermoplasmatota archaeon]|jgi:ornithine carbamoyltransferase|nr:ornithine carbamoyltransferase [Candidatus Thermoplasmatota archaeon]MCL5680418.1 ornithine carbamoyltransferase [Candidatus Thermoplasmatota archaeon]